MELLKPPFWARAASFKSLLVGLLLGFGLRTQASDESVDKLKAAFIYNFTKYISIPSEPQGHPFRVGVESDSELQEALTQAFAGKEINGHGFVVRSVSSAEQAQNCQFLVIADESPAATSRILAQVAQKPIVTIGEGDAFARAGGMIGFVESNGRLRFAINLASARAADVNISAQMLELAISVYR